MFGCCKERLFLWGIVVMVAGLCMLGGAAQARENQKYGNSPHYMLQLDSAALDWENQLSESWLSQQAAFAPVPRQQGIIIKPLKLCDLPGGISHVEIACCGHRQPIRTVLRLLVCRRC